MPVCLSLGIKNMGRLLCILLQRSINRGCDNVINLSEVLLACKSVGCVKHFQQRNWLFMKQYTQSHMHVYILVMQDFIWGGGGGGGKSAPPPTHPPLGFQPFKIDYTHAQKCLPMCFCPSLEIFLNEPLSCTRTASHSHEYILDAGIIVCHVIIM